MADNAVTSVNTTEDMNLVVIECAELDEGKTRQMQSEASAAAGQNRALPLVLDMSKVEFIPSLSLGALVELFRELKGHQQRFILVGLLPEVRKTFTITRLDKVLEVCETVEQAREHIRDTT